MKDIIYNLKDTKIKIIMAIREKEFLKRNYIFNEE